MSDGQTLRDVIRQMAETAEFYAGVVELRHTPTCWKLHTACALRRVLDVLDGEDETEDQS